MKREITSISLLKGFCAILVILVHAHLWGKVALIPFYRCAVPLFYMISGYFLMGVNGEWHREKIGRYIKKMLLIWIATDLIYFLLSKYVFTAYYPIHDGDALWHTLGLEVVFGGRFCYPLWYITAYVWVLVILRFWSCRRTKLNWMIIGILLLVNVLLGTYSFLLPQTFRLSDSSLSNNFLTSALPFVMLGGFLKSYVESRKKIIPFKYGLGVLILGYVELGFLYLMNSRNGDVFLATPFISIYIFLWFVLHPHWGKSSWISTIGREYSLQIYLLHVLVIWAVGDCAQYLGIHIKNIEFLIVLPVTIVICLVLRQLKKVILPPPTKDINT